MYSAILWGTQTHCALQYSPTFSKFHKHNIYIIMTTMYNIHTHKKYMCHMRSSNINESLYYYLPLIPSIPVPTPNSHTLSLSLSHTHTHTQVAVGMYMYINQKAWRKKCLFRLALKAGREGEALTSAGSKFQTVGAMLLKERSPKVFKFVFGITDSETMPLHHPS